MYKPLIRHSVKALREPRATCMYAKEMRKDRITALALLMWCFMKSARVSGVKNITHGISRHVRSIGFPEGSNMGIFFALGIPIDIPDYSISMAFYFEANYGLPNEWNSSYFYEEGYYVKRSLNRQLLYRVLINKMESLGYSGLDCLLRMICEVARYSLSENGVLGDILQIILAPSTSRSENLPNEIIEAEYEQHCDQRYEKCSMNPLDLIAQSLSKKNPVKCLSQALSAEKDDNICAKDDINKNLANY